MNSTLPLLALLLANRRGDPSAQSNRAFLLALAVRPPMMGFLIAMLAANQATKSTTAVAAGGATRKRPGKALTIVDKMIAKPDRSFFPSFMGLSRKGATHQAKTLGLSVTFENTPGDGPKEKVVAQDPKPEADFPRDLTEITLRLG